MKTADAEEEKCGLKTFHGHPPISLLIRGGHGCVVFFILSMTSVWGWN
jgi:hypothetical protein